MATNAMQTSMPPSNGVITAPSTVGGNRKKQKRRAKQAAKAASQPLPPLPVPAAGQPADIDYDEDPLGYGEDDYDYSDAEADHYHDQYAPTHPSMNGFSPPPQSAGRKKNKKKRTTSSAHHHHHHTYGPDMLPPLPNAPPMIPSSSLRTVHKTVHRHNNIWNTSTVQERQNIKDFWLSLSEDERKSLLKIEKEAVLRKMKQQQKHSCSCTVCGRKRTAIEEELEVLYEGYYEELEQYAHHDHPPLPSTDGLIPDPLQHRRPHPLAAPPPNPHHRTSHLHEHLDDEDYSSEESYSDEEEEYSDEEPGPQRGGIPDFFNFGQNLTVKDNLLTVADDLLKNDGRKFIEMMEQLAERRMQRESEAEYAAANPSHPGSYAPGDPGYNHEDPLATGDDYDDDEGSYDSQEEYDDEMDDEDEMGGLTEEQRMQEGRRMFQIFAARMFEQRVLTAYREKVAAERQQKLLEELQDEDKLAAEKEAKKQRDAAKKKEKKKQQQAAKQEEKAKKDAEKAAEEARLRELEEKKQEEQRRKREEQRRKKEEEKRRQDEEKARKEADRLRRQAEEQQKKDEAERRVREQKAAEKTKKDEVRRKEREEREAREKEARERKALEDKERQVREAKARAEKEVRERQNSASQTSQPAQPAPQVTKRPSQMGMVAVPGVYPKAPSSAISSPHPSIATPAIPKAPTPAKQRQASQQGSHASSPRQTQSQVSSAPSKSSSPGSVSASQPQPAPAPKTIMQKPSNPPLPRQSNQGASPPLHQPMQPPPGMPMPQQHPGSFGLPQMGFPGFSGPQQPVSHVNLGQRGPLPMYQQHQGPPMGVPNRGTYAPGMNGMPAPPPGMMSSQGRPMAFPFDGPGSGPVPPGFGQHSAQPSHATPIGQPPSQRTPGSDGMRNAMPAHSRQLSAGDKERFDNSATQPIGRPAPIQRPSSVKPLGDEADGSNSDIDDLSAHLGSKALLADDDEPLPSMLGDSRRHSGIPASARNGLAGGIGSIGGFGTPSSAFGAPGTSWTAPSLPFGQGSGLGQQSWNSLPNAGMGSWTQNHNAFGANTGFASIGSQIHRPSIGSINRPLTIRLAVCQACKQLNNALRGDGDGFHDVKILLKQIESNRPMLDSPPSLREIKDICETEGDNVNGGGELRVLQSETGEGFAVKWEPAAGTPDQGRGASGLGEIGSPVPSRTSPAGFGAPGMGRLGGLPNLGALGSPNY